MLLAMSLTITNDAMWTIQLVPQETCAACSLWAWEVMRSMMKGLPIWPKPSRPIGDCALLD